MHGDDVPHRAALLEYPALNQCERQRQQRPPRSVAEFPQERDKDDCLECVCDPERKVAAKQSEDDADKEEFVPNADKAHSNEQPGNFARCLNGRPVLVAARRNEIDRQDGVPEHQHGAEPRPLAARPRLTRSPGESHCVLPKNPPAHRIRKNNGSREHGSHQCHVAPLEICFDRDEADHYEWNRDEREVAPQ